MKLLLMLFILLPLSSVPKTKPKLSVANLPDTTLVTFEGSPDGYVARGLKRTFYGYDANIVARRWGDDGVIVSINSKNAKEWWSLQVSAPRGSALQAKAYTDTLRAGNDGTMPWLSFGGQGCECNAASGEFQIFEIVYDELGNLKHLALDFHIKEGQGQKKNWVKGVVRYHSKIPVDYPQLGKK